MFRIFLNIRICLEFHRQNHGRDNLKKKKKSHERYFLECHPQGPTRFYGYFFFANWRSFLKACVSCTFLFYFLCYCEDEGLSVPHWYVISKRLSRPPRTRAKKLIKCARVFDFKKKPTKFLDFNIITPNPLRYDLLLLTKITFPIAPFA